MEGVPDERGGVGEVAEWVSLRRRVVEGWWVMFTRPKVDMLAYYQLLISIPASKSDENHCLRAGDVGISEPEVVGLLLARCVYEMLLTLENQRKQNGKLTQFLWS